MDLEHCNNVTVPKMCAKYGFEKWEKDFGPENFEAYNATEYLLHELCHWLILGIKNKRNLSNVMGSVIEAMPKSLQDLNEARTCAVEILVLRELGIVGKEPNIIDFALDNIHMSTERFTTAVDLYTTTAKAKKLAAKALKILESGKL